MRRVFSPLPVFLESREWILQGTKKSASGHTDVGCALHTDIDCAGRSFERRGDDAEASGVDWVPFPECGWCLGRGSSGHEFQHSLWDGK